MVTGFAYGALLDVWDWTTFYRGAPGFGWQPGLSLGAALARFGRFYVTTSLVYDSFRAVGNAIAVIVLGAPVLAGLDPDAITIQRDRARPSPAARCGAGCIGQPEVSASTAKTRATIAPMTSGSFESGHGVRRLTAKVTPRVTAMPAPYR